jgi:hypothetical protein
MEVTKLEPGINNSGIWLYGVLLPAWKEIRE